MNKSEFIKEIAKRSDMTQKQAEDFYNVAIDVLSDTMESGEKIQLIGFGAFELKHREAHKGTNPRTKEEITIPAADVPSFKFSQIYKEKFN